MERCKRWKIKINEDKIQAIYFSRGKAKSRIFTLKDLTFPLLTK